MPIEAETTRQIDHTPLACGLILPWHSQKWTLLKAARQGQPLEKYLYKHPKFIILQMLWDVHLHRIKARL